MSRHLRLSLACLVSSLVSISVIAQAPSHPPDRTLYVRPGIPEDFLPGGRPPVIVSKPQPSDIILFLPVDLVVNNSDPNLKLKDMFGDTEPSIAINPADTSQITVLAFAERWAPGKSAPLWYSVNGGPIWTKELNIPPPPMTIFNGCPCDQTPDYTRDGTLQGAFLNDDDNIYSGDTVNPANPIAWNWWLNGGGAAQITNINSMIDRMKMKRDVDQPWLLVNRDDINGNQDNDYVAYDDFVPNPQDMRVAVALGPNLNPPIFTRDNRSGVGGGNNINPGHRLGVDTRPDGSGAVYSLFQRQRGASDGQAYPIEYRINRSKDGGKSWPLKPSANGCMDAPGDPDDTNACVITRATSTQAACDANCAPGKTFKFGTVNALLGGVDHLTVDPDNGDVYVVYGDRDGAGNNLLFVDRLGDNGTGGIKITGGPTIISPTKCDPGPCWAALPSIAVAVATESKWVGVLYDTFDGTVKGFPMFTVHFTVSKDRGATFNEVFTLNFLSPAIDNNKTNQRVLGDYQQLKAVGDTFYGTFTANGIAFRKFPFIANTDPFFFYATVGP